MAKIHGPNWTIDNGEVVETTVGNKTRRLAVAHPTSGLDVTLLDSELGIPVKHTKFKLDGRTYRISDLTKLGKSDKVKLQIKEEKSPNKPK